MILCACRLASRAWVRRSSKHCQGRAVGRGARGQSLFKLGEPAPRLLEGQRVAPRLDGGDQVGVVHGLQLGPPHVEAGGQQGDVVLRLPHRGVRLHLDDLLLGLLQLRPALLERVRLLARIELHDDVPSTDRGAGAGQPDEGQRPAGARRGQRGRALRAQLAGDLHVERHRAPRHAGHGLVRVTGVRPAVGRDHRQRSEDDDGAGRDGGVPDCHRSAIMAAGAR